MTVHLNGSRKLAAPQAAHLFWFIPVALKG
jgi:hypothetical protein